MSGANPRKGLTKTKVQARIDALLDACKADPGCPSTGTQRRRNRQAALQLLDSCADALHEYLTQRGTLTDVRFVLEVKGRKAT